MNSKRFKVNLWDNFKAWPFLIFIISACKSAVVPQLPRQEKPIPILVAVHSVPLLPSDSTNIAYEKLFTPKSVYQFYMHRDFRYLWLSDGKDTPLAETFLKLVESSRYYGLMAHDYHLKELINIHTGEKSEDAIIARELLMTDGLLRFLRHIRHGRLSEEVNDHLDSSCLAFLDSLTVGKDLEKLIEHYEPSIQYYRDLKVAMDHVLDTLPEVSRRYLLNGFSNDSIPGFAQVSAIEINLERLRAETLAWPARYLLVNIPAYTLQVMVQDTVSFQSRVIVGDPEHMTPTLTSQIECFTLYPYWYVPRKIAVEEYLPILQRDRSFITRNNFDVLNRKGLILSPDSIPWHTFHDNYFPVSLRQREGTENSLGLVKFIFDNPYAVYLHDTNAKRSFSYRVRALSHGCVRVERAMDLAHYLYTGKNNTRSRSIERLIEQKKRATINLNSPMPLMIRYYTCEYLHHQLHIYPDVYQMDKDLVNKFYKN